MVTGGGTGIGEAIAKVFAREGAKVAITGRRHDELERVVEDIERTGGEALALPGSVTNKHDVQEAVAMTVGTFRLSRYSGQQCGKFVLYRATSRDH